MSSLPISRDEDDKVGHISVDVREDAPTGVEITSKLDGQSTSVYERTGFLSAPISGPPRCFSPDVLSLLSVDELEQIRPSRRSSRVSQLDIGLTKPQGLRARLHSFWIRNKGLFLMLLAQFFGVLMNVSTRILEIEGNSGKGFHPFQILFVRMGITFVLASAYMYWQKTPHFPLGAPEVRSLLVARGFCGFFGVFGMYYSLIYLPLADATVITFLGPGLTCWVCSKLLKEPFTRAEMIGTFVSLIGVLFIARPTSLLHAFGPSANMSAPESPGANADPNPSDASDYGSITPAQRLEGVAVALLGVCGGVGAFTTIRWIGKRAHALLTVNYFAAWCTLVSLVMQFAFPSIGFLLPTNLKDWGLLIFLGTSGFIMQFLLATALSYEKSSRVTNMSYTQLLFALGFEKVVFGHTPGKLSIIGSSLILGSAIVVAYQKSTFESKEHPEETGAQGDEEAQRGLIANVETGEDHERLPLQDMQLTTLR